MKSNSIIVLIGVVLISVCAYINWGGDNWRYILKTDDKGYYAYLPAIFIYQDPNFGFFEEMDREKYYIENKVYDYRLIAEGKQTNKYFIGTSVAELPFFLVAHVVSGVTGQEQDGYSRYYPIFINIAAIFYLLVGLRCIHSLLRQQKLRFWEISVVLGAVAFGTNAFYYVISEPGMSHIFSFAFISVFLLNAYRFLQEHKPVHFLYACMALGMIILIRPVNLMILLFIPFITGSFKAVKDEVGAFYKRPGLGISGILLILLTVSIQPVFYKISTGHFFVYSYANEGFNFSDPHFFDFLFSYKKGLFLYTPMYLLALSGFYYLFKTDKFRFYSGLAFLVTVIYVLSSWWNWWYGGSFSSRVMIDYLPVFAILMGYAFLQLKQKLHKFIFIAIIAGLTGICQIQTYQYRYAHIHWDSMTKEKYWDRFLRIDRLI